MATSLFSKIAESSEFIAFNAHWGFAFFLMALAAHLHASIVVVTVALVLLAAVKEFYIDVKYETDPPQNIWPDGANRLLRLRVRDRPRLVCMSETWKSMDDLPLIPTWKLRTFRAKLWLLIVFGSVVAGCSSPAHSPAQSWDQENLKRHDVGCPHAIYYGPHAELCR